MNNNFAIAMDMDGVLVNFEKGIRDNFDLDVSHLNKSRKQMSPEDAKAKSGVFDQIQQMGEKFWTDLDPMPDGLALWQYVKANFNQVFVLTAYISSGTDACIAGKKVWVKENLHLNANERNFICVKSKEKQNFVKHLGNIPTILIDDRPKNISEWVAKGGIGVLHVDTYSTIEKLKEIVSPEK